MIEDGQIAYGLSESRLLTWDLQNPVLRAFLAGLFSTILSYQIAAAITDLLLGCKSRGKARVTDIGCLLLSQEGSPLSVFKSLLRGDIATCLYQRRESLVLRRLRRRRTGHLSDEDSEHNRIRSGVWLKLIILLAVAPVVNLAAVAITVERESELTFQDMAFGGMALGINDNLSFLLSPRFFDSCFEYIPKKLDDREAYVAQFFRCQDVIQVPNVGQGPLGNDKTVSIEIATVSGGIVSVSLLSAGEREMWWDYANIKIADKVYRLREDFSVESGKTLMALAERGLTTLFCRADLQPKKIGDDVTFNGDNFVLTRTFSQCHENIFSERTTVFFGRVSLRLTFIEAKMMQLALEERPSLFPNRTGEFFPSDNLPLLLRRRSLISSAVLGILAAASVVVRVTVKLMTNNDLENGVELLIKRVLMLKRYDSMLQSPATAHYGLDGMDVD